MERGCVEDQPQQPHQLGTLRLVFDTAALRNHDEKLRPICYRAPLLLFVPGMKRKKSIKPFDGVDYVTQDMIIGILGGEEDHRRKFIGLLKEYEKK